MSKYEEGSSFNWHSRFTLSVVRHRKIGLPIDFKGFPVTCTVGLQGLDPNKLFSFFAPLVNHREIHWLFVCVMPAWLLSRVWHHQKRLDQSTKTQNWPDAPANVDQVDVCFCSVRTLWHISVFLHTFFPIVKCLQASAPCVLIFW